MKILFIFLLKKDLLIVNKYNTQFSGIFFLKIIDFRASAVDVSRCLLLRIATAAVSEYLDLMLSRDLRLLIKELEAPHCQSFGIHIPICP
jgi:hypothetical protein